MVSLWFSIMSASRAARARLSSTETPSLRAPRTASRLANDFPAHQVLWVWPSSVWTTFALSPYSVITPSANSFSSTGFVFFSKFSTYAPHWLRLTSQEAFLT